MEGIVQVGEWIEHGLGQPMPVDSETLVLVKQELGSSIWEDDYPIHAGYWDEEDPEESNWATTEPNSGNIIAYRIVTTDA